MREADESARLLIGAPSAIAAVRRPGGRRSDVSATSTTSCFIRIYDAAHLAEHPGQRVAAMSGRDPSSVEDESLRARHLRAARRRELRASAGDCYDEDRRRLPLPRSARTTAARRASETFKVLLDGRRTRSAIVNDTTGVTGGGRRAAPRDHLAAGGEHGVFALDRAPPYSRLRRTDARHADHRRHLQGECPPARSTTRSCSGRSSNVRSHFIDKRAAAVAALPEFEQLREQARGDQGPHARPSRPLSRSLRGARDRGGRARAFRRDRRGRARHHPRHLPQRRRPHRHQGQVDDLRGDRPERAPRGERHRGGRDRSRRIHHPASRRGAEPHHRAGRAREPGPGGGGFPPRPHASAAGPRPLRADEPARRGARHPARPLPRRRCRHHRREFSGRRDRHARSSSPTRGTAT